MFEHCEYLERYLAYTKDDEVDPNYSLWSCLATLAAVGERRVWLDWGVRRIRYYPNMYICLIGPPGARKSTAMGAAYDLLKHIDIYMTPESTPWETLIYDLSRQCEVVHDPKTGGIYHYSGGLAFARELTSFIGIKDSYRIKLLCDFYDCVDRFRYNTHARGDIVIENVFLNILAGTTPQDLQHHLPPEAIGGGFTSRFIMVHGEPPEQLKSGRGTEEARNTSDRHMQWLIERLRRIRKLAGGFETSPEYEELYEDWRNRSRKDPPTPSYDPKLTHYMSRRETHLRKLTMALSLARSDELVLRASDFRLAERILHVTEQVMPRAMLHVNATPTERIANELFTLIAHLPGGASFAELMRRYVTVLTKDQMTMLLDAMVTAELLKRVTVKNEVRYVLGDKPPKESRLWTGSRNAQ